MSLGEMDFNMESPFSLFELGDELFPLPSLPPSPCIDDIPISIPQLPLENSNNNTSQNPKNGRRKKPPPLPPPPPSNTLDDIGDETTNEHKKKKIIHRDVERQRRQEMSSLYTNLRSLLPLEYVKGKRSICDHMHETVKYIRDMQSNIEQLSNKRDELKKLSVENPVVNTVETLNSSGRDTVMVRPRKGGGGGVQVVLNTSTQHRLPVSIILQALAVEGLEILSCISTKVNGRFIHTIESQVVADDGRYPSIDVSELQHKLMNLKYFPID